FVNHLMYSAVRLGVNRSLEIQGPLTCRKELDSIERHKRAIIAGRSMSGHHGFANGPAYPGHRKKQ
ncbi:MAG: hypothetical protein RLN69_16150, partial [Woeseiaceae bacterium]